MTLNYTLQYIQSQYNLQRKFEDIVNNNSVKTLLIVTNIDTYDNNHRTLHKLKVKLLILWINLLLSFQQTLFPTAVLVSLKLQTSIFSHSVKSFEGIFLVKRHQNYIKVTNNLNVLIIMILPSYRRFRRFQTLQISLSSLSFCPATFVTSFNLKNKQYLVFTMYLQ